MAMKNSYNNEILERFEEKLARFIGVKHIIVTGSGRAALEIIFKSLELEKRPVICSCLSCSIVPQTIIRAGSTPHFVDIREDLSMNVDQIRETIPRECSGILTNYLYGCPTDAMEEILEYARQKELVVIEDAAQSFGADIGDHKVGSIGDAAIYSFPKIFFPLYRGGFIATNRTDIAKKARVLRTTLQSSPDLISLKLTNIKKRISPAVGALRAHLAGPTGSFYTHKGKWGYDPYYYFEPTYPYQYWDLTENEIQKGISTVEMFGDLKKIRMDMVRQILTEIEQRWNSVISQIVPYRKEYVYSRIPVLINPDRYDAIKLLLRTHRVRIDMNYRPLSNNTLFHNTSSASGACSKAQYVSHYMTPLPVTNQMVQILQKDNPSLKGLI